MDIVEQLRKSAITASEASKWLAAEKSARNRAAEGSNATYWGAEPHQTLEWRAGQEIERLRDALNRIANACRFPTDDFQRAMLKVATDALGEAYNPFPVKIPG